MRLFSKLAIAASCTLLGSTALMAQTLNPGTTVNGGVVTLDSNGQPAGTSYETSLNFNVKNGDTISFEYKGPCGGGAPRVFIQGGAFNTFDPDPNNTACGTDTDGDGFFTVTQTISGITAGSVGAIGIVNDNVSNPSIVQVRNLVIAGVRIDLTSGSVDAAETCKNRGFAALGFRNQGECVSSFRSNRPSNR